MKVLILIGLNDELNKLIKQQLIPKDYHKLQDVHFGYPGQCCGVYGFLTHKTEFEKEDWVSTNDLLSKVVNRSQ